ncbi:cell adhesion molecule Dscam2-like isoform X2 [Dysidea avara]|uniref:cell adhesion molecule Dscam2-like isoform X2 n=1 Tax=Dysidea avara TaxID=196820 RepID=UPI00331F7174
MKSSAPQFTSEPEDRVVVAQRNNENAIESFPCNYDGPNITVTWYRNDVVVPADSSHIIHDNGTLEITAIVVGVDATIAGVRYHCVLSNEVGSIRSRPALIQLASFGNDWNSVASNTTMVDVTLGSYILLPCNPPMANPAPMVSWTINSSPIDISTTDKYKVLPSGDLIVGNVAMNDISDGGNPHMYRCEVVNRLIFENIPSPYSYQLRQVDRYSENLTIYNTLENAMLQIGSNAELVCLAIANDITRLDYFVRKTGFLDLDSNMRGPMSTTNTNIDCRHTLFIDGVRGDNAGEYVCSVGDFVTGSTVQLHVVPFNISVFAPPMIISSPDDITMYSGDSIPIPCVVTGLPAPSISYRVNTSMLSVTGGMLTNVSVTDSGAYQCFVENIHGVFTASWTVTVRDPAAPVIVNMSGDGTVPEYGDLDIFIEVSADPMPSVDWLLNGVNINSSDRQMFTMRQYNTTACPVTYLLELSVINFTASDSGQYSVVITTRAGTTQPSFTYLLEVPVAVTEVKGVGESCIIRNENTDLTCLVTGVPTPTIQWFRSGGNDDRVTITTDSKYTVMDNILIINNVNNDDADRYGCTASNMVNGMERTATTADTFSVCAFPVASIDQTTLDQLINVGTSVRITCSGRGDPPPSYMWFKEDKNGVRTNPMEQGHIQMGEFRTNTNTDSFLEFSMLMRNDSGTYVCVVFNSAGTRETSIVLEVEEPSEGNDDEDFPLWAIIVAAVGGATILFVIVILIIFLVRYRITSKKYGVSQNVPYSGGPRGRDEDDDDQTYNPQYESLPAPTPMRPPEYKPTPGYPSSVTARTPVPYGGSMMEMQKDMIDGMQQPRYDDFLSSDGQFV